MVDAVVEIDERMIRCEASLPPGSPYADGRRASSIATIEMAAQAAAMHQVFLGGDRADRKVRVGYVVRIRASRMGREYFSAAETVEISAELTGAAPPLSIYRIAARASDGAMLLTARIGMWTAESPDGS